MSIMDNKYIYMWLLDRKGLNAHLGLDGKIRAMKSDLKITLIFHRAEWYWKVAKYVI